MLYVLTKVVVWAALVKDVLVPTVSRAAGVNMVSNIRINRSFETQPQRKC